LKMKQTVIVLVLLCGYVAFVSAACSGSPPTYNGLPCATTTRYYDDDEGACGCGSSSGPYAWYTTTYTAAASQAVFDSGGATWCGAGCGICFQITPTGDCPTGGNCASSTTPIVIMVTNLCPYNGNTVWCPNPGNANEYGYHQHFDLQDNNMAGLISAMGWNNPVVTYKQVPCSSGNINTPSCADAEQCLCSTEGSPISTNCAAGSAASATSAKSSTTTAKASTTTTTTAKATTGTATTAKSSTSSTTGSSGGTCSLSVSFSSGNVVFTNTGSKVVKGATFTVSGSFSWSNFVEVSGSTYEFPTYENSLAVGATYNGAGYSGTAPTITNIVASC